MGRRLLSTVLLLFIAPVLATCTGSPSGLVVGGDVLLIRLQVSGGLAGADYAVFLDGESGRLVGESCANLCDFHAGETLQTLSWAQVEYLEGLFVEAGVTSLADEDYGTECCDQFHYAVRFREGTAEHRFQGSSEALPRGLRDAVATLQGMASGVLPIVVDPQTTPGAWPGDPFQLGTAEIHGDFLDVPATYSGGCTAHDLKAVAWGGWIKTDPVQLRVFLSHEDFDDACEALVTRVLSFDLGPVKGAYQADYGVEGPGETTVILLLDDPDAAGAPGVRSLSYIF